MTRHYAHLAHTPFFDELLRYMTSGPVMVTAWAGRGAISSLRRIVGATDPARATAGTVRGDLGATVEENVAHASENTAEAEREAGIWFP